MSELFSSHSPLPGQPGLPALPDRLIMIDAEINRQASRYLKEARQQLDRLTDDLPDGWQVQKWGKTVFGQYQGSGSASLLVYFPALPASRYNLSALLAAAAAWQTVAGELPVTLKFLWGPLDKTLLSEHAADLAASAIIYAEGEYRQGRPLISLGMKGLLEVELRVTTMSKAAPSVFSEIMPAASWTLVQAIAALKSDSQEVQIEDFEDNLAPLPAEESRALLKATPDFSPELARRLEDYGLSGYVFNLNDQLVLQTQFMVPTVNVSALECGSFDRAGRLKLPASARARLDFHLVPYQDPDQVFELVKNHLLSKDFGPQLEIIQLPGALRPSRTPLSAAFIQAALGAAKRAAGQPPLVGPISLFSGPLALLKVALGSPPAICFGLGPGRPGRADFSAQARVLAHLLTVVPGLPGDFPETFPDWPVSSLQNFPDQQADPEGLTFELPDLPDFSDISQLIPDFPEMENDPFGSAPKNKPGNFSLS
ncbi:MAG: hypothetical protein JWP00_770 [Chloroflexi bacterium]|nr:hypothetical protein [Chloroflexota bacterium]